MKPRFRGSGIVAALVARLCSEAAAAGAEFLHGGGADGPSVREIVRRLPPKALGRQPAE